MSRYFLTALSLTLLGLSQPARAQISLPSIGGVKLPAIPKGATSGVTQDEAAGGLKEALMQGISKGADQASQTDGFNLNSLIRLPFPPDAQRVATTLRKIGLGAQVDQFELSLNRGAEEAAKSAKPIFLAAIKNLSFADVWNILSGSQDAATQYLKRTTAAQLTAVFQPIIQQSLDQVGATRHYAELTTRYNKIPLVTPVNTDLNQYATGKAIDGLFTLVAQEEANIRQNPMARTSDLLKKVFGAKK